MKNLWLLAFIFCWSTQVRSQNTVTDSAAIYHDMATAKYGEEDYNTAILYLSKAIASFPIRDYIFFRGVICLQVGRYDEALNDFSSIIESNPKDISVWCFRGNVRMKLKQYYMALADYNKAIEAFDPHKDEYYMGSQSYELRGRVYAELGQYNKALEDYTTAIGLDAGAPQFYRERAEIYHKLGLEKEAEKDLATAEKLIEEANK